jgi:hypothetical protein
MGRRPKFTFPMTNAERQARWRARQKAARKASDSSGWTRNVTHYRYDHGYSNRNPFIETRSPEQRRRDKEKLKELERRLECYHICHSLAQLDVPKDLRNHPNWKRDWRGGVGEWQPPPGLLEHLAQVERDSKFGTLPWFYYHEGSPAREFMGHYDPDVGWPWRKDNW